MKKTKASKIALQLSPKAIHFQKYYAEKKKIIDQQISKYSESLRKKASSSQAGYPPKIAQAMTYALTAGGKRLRPILTLMGYDALLHLPLHHLAARPRPQSDASVDQIKQVPAAAKSFRQQVVKIALALEMIHTYSLIHDDLPAMDNDALRRGKPTCHKVFGDAMAILAGDALLTEAFTVLAQCGGGQPATLATLLAETTRAAGIKGMLGGQVLDIQSQDISMLSQLQAMHHMKTGALIRFSLCAPFYHAQLHKTALCQALERYAIALGLLFQITDDILDYTETKENLGKPARSDLRNNKTTYLSFLSVAEAYGHAEKALQQAQASLKKISLNIEASAKTPRGVGIEIGRGSSLSQKTNTAKQHNLAADASVRKMNETLTMFSELAKFVYSRKK